MDQKTIRTALASKDAVLVVSESGMSLAQVISSDKGPIPPYSKILIMDIATRHDIDPAAFRKAVVDLYVNFPSKP